MANTCTKVLAKGKSKGHCRNGLMVGGTGIPQHLLTGQFSKPAKRVRTISLCFNLCLHSLTQNLASALFFADFGSCSALLMDCHSITVAVAALLLHYIPEMLCQVFYLGCLLILAVTCHFGRSKASE